MGQLTNLGLRVEWSLKWCVGVGVDIMMCM